jgi:hypothetical protein
MQFAVAQINIRVDDTPSSATKCSSDDKPAFADFRQLGWFGIKIISTYIFNYYSFFLEKITQKAGLIAHHF